MCVRACSQKHCKGDFKESSAGSSCAIVQQRNQCHSEQEVIFWVKPLRHSDFARTRNLVGGLIGEGLTVFTELGPCWRAGEYQIQPPKCVSFLARLVLDIWTFPGDCRNALTFRRCAGLASRRPSSGQQRALSQSKNFGTGVQGPKAKRPKKRLFVYFFGNSFFVGEIKNYQYQ